MARLNALTGARNVTIVGGTVAVSAAVETQLRGMGFNVTRLGGSDRYATSEEIITAGRAQANPIGLVASGLSFPDALAGAPLSYKGKHPVFLTAGATIPQDTIDAMVAAGTRQVIILGGTAAVPASVEAALVARGITVVTRLGGAGRSETSRIIADYLINNQGFTNTTSTWRRVPRAARVRTPSAVARSRASRTARCSSPPRRRRGRRSSSSPVTALRR
jgi:putative cell wall-binding protein